MSGWDDLDRRLFAGVRAASLEEDTTSIPPGAISVTKLGAQLSVSTDMLMDEGLIPDTRPARPRRTPVRVTPWTLARARARTAVADARLRVGCWIAGVQVAEYDDDETDVDWCDGDG